MPTRTTFLISAGYELPDINVASRLIPVEAVVDMLFLNLSVIDIYFSLQAIQHNRLVQVRSSAGVIDSDMNGEIAFHKLCQWIALSIKGLDVIPRFLAFDNRWALAKHDDLTRVGLGGRLTSYNKMCCAVWYHHIQIHLL